MYFSPWTDWKQLVQGIRLVSFLSRCEISPDFTIHSFYRPDTLLFTHKNPFYCGLVAYMEKPQKPSGVLGTFIIIRKRALITLISLLSMTEIK